MKKNLIYLKEAFNSILQSPWPFYTFISLLTLTTTGMLTTHGFNNAEYCLYFALLSIITSIILWFRDIIIDNTYLQLKYIIIHMKVNILKAFNSYMAKLTIENLLILIIKRLLIYAIFFIIYLIFCQYGIGPYFGQIKLILYLLLLILLIRKVYRDYKIKNENLVFYMTLLALKLLTIIMCCLIFNSFSTMVVYELFMHDDDDYSDQSWLGVGEVNDDKKGPTNSNPEPNNNNNNSYIPNSNNNDDNDYDDSCNYIDNRPLKDLSYDEQVKAIKDKPIYQQISLIETQELDEELHRSRLIKLVKDRLINYLNSDYISSNWNKRTNLESYIYDREGALQTLNDIAMFGGKVALKIVDAKALGGEEGERRVEELTKAGMDYLDRISSIKPIIFVDDRIILYGPDLPDDIS